jgi:hypothetical protein
MEAIRQAVEHNSIINFILVCLLLFVAFFRVTLADLTCLTPDWGTSRCFKHLFGRFEIPATTPRGSRTRPRANGSSSFVPS